MRQRFGFAIFSAFAISLMKLEAEWLWFCHFSGLCHKFDETVGGVALSFDRLAFAIENVNLRLFRPSASFGFMLDMCLYRSLLFNAFD